MTLIRATFAFIALAIVSNLGLGSAAATASSVKVADSCYSSQRAAHFGHSESQSDGGDRWLATDIVQMSLRHISLLVAAEPLYHGYEIDEEGQSIALVHHPDADLTQVASAVEAAMHRGVPDIGTGSTTEFPEVLLYPACRSFDAAATFDELEALFYELEWTDEPIFETIRLVTQRDLVTSQIVAVVEAWDPTSEKIAAQLAARFPTDVRVDVDPTHPFYSHVPLVKQLPSDQAPTPDTTGTADATGTAETPDAPASGTTAEKLPIVAEASPNEQALGSQSDGVGVSIANDNTVGTGLLLGGVAGALAALVAGASFRLNRRR